MKIAIANDHRGFFMKEEIGEIVSELGHEWIDFGCSGEQPVDYPDIAYVTAMAVAKKEVDRAVLICSVGMGMCIAANKVKGVRAVTCYDEVIARISRTHDDANILCLAGDLTGSHRLEKMLEVWLDTPFKGGRHERRIKKIDAIEQGHDPRKIK